MSSKGQANVAAVVMITVVVTSGVLVAAWFAAPLVLNQPTANAVKAEAPVTPTPRRKAARTSRKDADHPAAADSAAANAGVTAADTSARDTAGTADMPSPNRLAAGTEAAAVAAVADVKPVPTAPPPTADAPADPRAIMDEAQRRSEARFYRYDGLLQSYDAKDKVTEKRWTFDRVGSNGQSKSVLRFTSPPEVKGVALLIFNHPERASDQWMWTPALERDRRIALQDRSTRFFGTDFSFEDLEERDVEQYDYALLGSEPIDGVPCWKIESTPRKSRSSQYTRLITWVRKDNYAFARQDNFVKDEVVRRIVYSNLENIQNIWTARQLEMSDLRRGTRTRLTLEQVKYNAPVKEQDFTLEAIKQ